MSIVKKIALVIKAKNIPVCDNALCIKMGGGNNGGKGKALTEKQIRLIDEFAKEVIEIQAKTKL